jgi:hypothetical protein
MKGSLGGVHLSLVFGGSASAERDRNRVEPCCKERTTHPPALRAPRDKTEVLQGGKDLVHRARAPLRGSHDLLDRHLLKIVQGGQDDGP